MSSSQAASQPPGSREQCTYPYPMVQSSLLSSPFLRPTLQQRSTESATTSTCTVASAIWKSAQLHRGGSGRALSVLPLAATIYGRRPLCSPCDSSCKGSSRSSHSTFPHRGCVWRGYESVQSGVEASSAAWPLLFRTSTNTGHSVGEGIQITTTDYPSQPYRARYLQQDQRRHPEYQQQGQLQLQQHQQQQRRHRRRRMKRPLAAACDKGVVAFPDHNPSASYGRGESKADYQGFTENSNAGDGGVNGGVGGGNNAHHTGTVVCSTQLG
uniref:Uncharacterized protein n=1 Tax=Anopheles culicifacies TaxID=139723 RepID=A0A182MF27_9DIPT